MSGLPSAHKRRLAAGWQLAFKTDMVSSAVDLLGEVVRGPASRLVDELVRAKRPLVYDICGFYVIWPWRSASVRVR